MNKSIFLKLQIKRMFKAYPVILLITLITLTVIGLAGYGIVKKMNDGEEKQQIALGLVGGVDGTFLEFGLELFESGSDSGIIKGIIEMDEESAVKALKNGEITGYIVVPEDYVDGMLTGRNIPASLVTIGEPQTINTVLTNRLAETLSHLLTETQAGISTLKYTLRGNRMANRVSDAVSGINLVYIDFVMHRSDIYTTEYLGLRGLSAGGYYICAAILFFLLVSGISYNKILTDKNLSLSRLMKRSGKGAFVQIMCEHFAYFVTVSVTVILLLMIGGIVVGATNINIAELAAAGVTEGILFGISLLPVVYMITMMHIFIYEIADGTVSAVLLNFVSAVGLGYITGCFYPINFFPDAFQKVSGMLPSGMAFTYIRNIMGDCLNFENFISVVCWAGVFAMLTTLVRRFRIGGERV